MSENKIFSNILKDCLFVFTKCVFCFLFFFFLERKTRCVIHNGLVIHLISTLDIVS